MENEFQKMQRLAGVPVAEVKITKNKKSLNENFVGIGAINNPFPTRKKSDYELAFDHYVGNITEVEGEEEMDVEEMGEENPIDAITMDVPLFIRMLEFAREDASTDMDLHDLADKAIAMSTEGEMLSMDNYEDLVGEKAIEEGIHDRDITSASHTNIKTPPKGTGDYDTKDAAERMKRRKALMDKSK
jgi:hypothetical protein